MKNILTKVSLLLVLFLIGCTQSAEPDSFSEALYTITVGTMNSSIDVYIADEDSERQKGLGGIDELPENTGMYFIYNSARVREYWMLDVEYPIDIIWLHNNKVVYLTKSAQPEANITLLEDYQRYSSPVPINAVLEVPEGFIEQYDIIEGNVLTLTEK